MGSDKETSTSAEMELMKKKLFSIAMKGEWNEVVNIYRENPSSHKVKITISGDTALHIAVSDGKEDIVDELIRLIRKEEGFMDALKIENERGQTPLHLAASMGNVRMCKSIAKVDSKLVGFRNHDSETPFFLTALYGKKDAFLCLHDICSDGHRGYSYSRRKDGETILHCAIAGDYFDLAYQIILLYDKLVNYVNEQGFSPLHLLAGKPSAFRSGSHLAWLNKIIYHCIFVDELKPEPRHDDQPLLKTFEEENNPLFPPNYQSCTNFFRLLWKLIQVVTTRKHSQKRDELVDVEYPRARPQGFPSTSGPRGHHQLFPSNYGTCFDYVKLVSKGMLVILGLGSTRIKKLQDKKEKHTWSVQIMNELLQSATMYEYEDNGRNPEQLPSHKDDETKPYAIGEEGSSVTFVKDAFTEGPQPASPTTTSSESDQEVHNREKNGKDKNGKDENGIGEKRSPERTKRETPILIAAKNGVTEMVEKILELFPLAIHDMNSDKKNIVLLAVENRQPHVYELLLKRTILKDSVFHKVDNKGNSALHHAATLGEHRPWLIPGAALQMQWEIKWYEFVKHSLPLHFFARHNNAGKTPRDIFTESHEKLVKSGGKWLVNTSESCSVVAALIATVAFATSSTVPGGVKQDIGTPTLENHPAFDVFAISSLVALCFSVTAVVMFLAILTSRYQERDFGQDLPRKLLLGLTSLLISIASMLISFCAGHFFVLKDKLKYAAFPVYAVTCLPVTFFAVAQFPLYFDLIWATFKKVPQRSYQAVA